jgi:putative phage-type endonuclease
MPRVTLEQGTADWLEWRHGGIGASDAPIIMHESPFKTAFGLWLEKTGQVQPRTTNFAQAHGITNEPLARAEFVRQTGIEVEPACFQSDEASYIRVSLDGWNTEDRVVVELKSPTSDRDHRRAREGWIPPYYWIQIQHEIAVTGAQRAYYGSYFQEELILVPVDPAPDYWLGELLPAEQEFWRRVRDKDWPEPDGVLSLTGSDELEFRAMVEARDDADWREHVAKIDRNAAEAWMKRRLAVDNHRVLAGAGVRAAWSTLKPQYFVQVRCTTQQAQEQALKALAPLKQKAGIVAVEDRTLPPSMRFTISRPKEKS